MEEFQHATIEKSNVPYTFRPTLHVALNKPIDDLWAATSYTAILLNDSLQKLNYDS